MHKCVNSGVLGACLETESALVALDGSLLVRPFILGAERWGYALRFNLLNKVILTSSHCL